MGTYNYIVVPKFKICFPTKLDEFTLDHEILEILDTLSDENKFCDLNEQETLEVKRKILNSQKLINDLCCEPYLYDYYLLIYFRLKDEDTYITNELELPKGYKCLD